MAASRRRNGPSSSSESDDHLRKGRPETSHRGFRGGDSDQHRDDDKATRLDSRVSSRHRHRESRKERRRISEDDSDSEDQRRERRSKDERLDPGDRRRKNRDKSRVGSDDESSPRRRERKGKERSNGGRDHEDLKPRVEEAGGGLVSVDLLREKREKSRRSDDESSPPRRERKEKESRNGGRELEELKQRREYDDGRGSGDRWRENRDKSRRRSDEENSPRRKSRRRSDEENSPRRRERRGDRRQKDRELDGLKPRGEDDDRRRESRDQNRPHLSERRDDRREKDRGIGNSRRDPEAVNSDEIVLPPPPPLPPSMADANSGKSGGIYIPPFRMAQMMREFDDKSSEAYQRLSWDALRKSINGLVNKVNATNLKNIVPELLSENLIRGRGLFCRSCMKSQMASPGFTDVFSALVAVVNTKFHEVGELLLRRIVLQLRRAYKRNDKPQLLAATKFIAHLVNQQVAHEIIALELLTVLLENPTDDSVEVAVGFVKECGALLQDFSPQGLHGIFERFRGILHEGEIDKRVQFLIEGLFAIRKAKFQGFPAIRAELDLVNQEDQFTHEISLEDEIDPETNLDVFKPNPQFLEDEKAYEKLKIDILGSESSEDEGTDVASDDEDEEESEEDDDEQMQIKDETETNLVNLRRTIYLTIMSSVDFEEAGHKLLKIKLEPGQEMELCIMLLECCSQERTYLRYYGLLGQRFCMINKVHQENFEKCFVQQYSMIHRLETNKLRNVAKFFAHLLGTSALPWHVLSYIRLTEEDTTSSSRIFIKILFQELSEHLGIRLLNERLNDKTLQDSFESIFPKDNPKNTRFSINFFTSIGLGGITESLREYLKNMPRLIMQQQKPVPDSGSDGSASSSTESSSESETESDSSSDKSKRGKRRRRSKN